MQQRIRLATDVATAVVARAALSGRRAGVPSPGAPGSLPSDARSRIGSERDDTVVFAQTAVPRHLFSFVFLLLLLHPPLSLPYGSIFHSTYHGPVLLFAPLRRGGVEGCRALQGPYPYRRSGKPSIRMRERRTRPFDDWDLPNAEGSAGRPDVIRCQRAG